MQGKPPVRTATIPVALEKLQTITVTSMNVSEVFYKNAIFCVLEYIPFRNPFVDFEYRVQELLFKYMSGAHLLRHEEKILSGCNSENNVE